ncbi:hypothetical protein OIU78_027282 [Salix suchowensis]|nr:hypothetical protein OIU78_027282 [Salix suchowensis]
MTFRASCPRSLAVRFATGLFAADASVFGAFGVALICLRCSPSALTGLYYSVFVIFPLCLAGSPRRPRLTLGFRYFAFGAGKPGGLEARGPDHGRWPLHCQPRFVSVRSG